MWLNLHGLVHMITASEGIEMLGRRTEVEIVETAGEIVSQVLQVSAESWIAFTDQLWRISDCDDTRRVSPFRPEGPAPPLRCRRFAHGYAPDGSECPCCLVWQQRDGQSYVLLDTSTADTLVLDQSFFRPLGMQHFYDSLA